jgi:hypothetical protein
MNVVVIELLLWGCLLLFFWAMKDGLNDVESNIESRGLVRDPSSFHSAQHHVHCCRPQSVKEPIGRYRGAQIYRYAVIDGRRYQFDRVCPSDGVTTIDESERCVEPGLVYSEYGAQDSSDAES